ncbi:hypothetical protein [Halostella litorea]|uniref:hypothetical protein n=1 Tax=Halostella litorea TaxID=2528831 RepID=UPI00109216A5|nr:hypothetical protein [Halostella litorea]
MPSTRRDVLRLAGVGATAALAGCSDAFGGPLNETTADDGSAPSPARGWLYDPTDYEDQTSLTATFQSPARLTAASDHLADELPPEVPGLRFDATLPPDETEWSVLVASPLFEGPSLFACGGGFDAETAAENADAYTATNREPTGEETVGDLSVRHYGDDRHGASREGLVVSANAASAAEFRALLQTDETLADSVAGSESLVARTGFDEAATLALSRDSGKWVGWGVGYDIGGAETRVTRTELRTDRDADAVRALGEAVDGLTDVTAEEQGDLAWLEGTASTDRLAFDGSLFSVMELPYGGE